MGVRQLFPSPQSGPAGIKVYLRLGGRVNAPLLHKAFPLAGRKSADFWRELLLGPGAIHRRHFACNDEAVPSSRGIARASTTAGRSFTAAGVLESRDLALAQL
jgi:hypothetical protein